MSGLRWLIDQYLQLPRWERMGNIILLSLVFILFGLISFWPESPISKEESRHLDIMAAQLQSVESPLANQKEKTLKPKKNEILHNDGFLIADLYKANQQDFIQAGLSKKVAKGLYNYLQKGGKIKSEKDVHKIYGMTPKMALEFSKHIVWDTTSYKKENKTFYSKKTTSIVDLNVADTTELKLVNGIGSKLAQNIVKYRELIGQYHSVDQLNEVRGMFPENFEKVKEFVVVNEFTPFININTIQAKDLKKHYYFRKNNLAEALVAYREKHGVFKTIEDVKKCVLVTPEVFAKIKPYLVIE